jgi:membrane glycosyltransferase
MVPRPWTGFWRGLWLALFGAAVSQPDVNAPAWKAAASRRRAVLMVIVIASTAMAASLLFHTQTASSAHPVLHLIQLVIFVVLFGWVTAGFVTAMMGFLVQLHPDPHALPLAALDPKTLDRDARTAIIMPIYNEPVASVFAGLRATCESLARSKAAGQFDIYVLSDTHDPDLRLQELAAWSTLREQLGDSCRLYYRLRQRRIRRKAGNVADFCRRWGRNYRYMVVLDADNHAGVHDGSEPESGNHPDCTTGLRRAIVACQVAAICRTGGRSPVHGWHAVLAIGRIPLLGA